MQREGVGWGRPEELQEDWGTLGDSRLGLGWGGSVGLGCIPAESLLSNTGVPQWESLVGV